MIGILPLFPEDHRVAQSLPREGAAQLWPQDGEIDRLPPDDVLGCGFEAQHIVGRPWKRAAPGDRDRWTRSPRRVHTSRR